MGRFLGGRMGGHKKINEKKTSPFINLRREIPKKHQEVKRSG